MIKKTGIKRSAAGLLLVLLSLCMLWLCSVRTETAVPVSADIPVSVSGGNPLESFTFVMEMKTKEMQTPDRLMLRLRSGEEDAFTIRYVYPGTYHYRIRQEAGTDSKTTYDTTVYEVDIYVTEDGKGTLHAEPVVYAENSSEKSTKIHFKNSAEGKASKNSRAASVQTGDSNRISPYLASAAGAALLAVLLYASAMRKKREENRG